MSGDQQIHQQLAQQHRHFGYRNPAQRHQVRLECQKGQPRNQRRRANLFPQHHPEHDDQRDTAQGGKQTGCRTAQAGGFEHDKAHKLKQRRDNEVENRTGGGNTAVKIKGAGVLYPSAFVGDVSDP